MNTYTIEMKAVVRKTMVIEASTEDELYEIANETFSILEDGNPERYEQYIDATHKHPRLVEWDVLIGAIKKAIEDIDDIEKICKFAKDELDLDFSEKHARESLQFLYDEVDLFAEGGDTEKISSLASVTIGGECEYHEDGIFLFESEEDSTDVFSELPICEISMAQFVANGKTL